MGQLVNPIGFRVGKKKSFFWSSNVSFFFNKINYRKLTNLFRYLDCVLFRFEAYLRAMYARSIIFGKRYFNVLGAAGCGSLVITLSVFDIFRVLSGIPKYIKREIRREPSVPNFFWKVFAKNSFSKLFYKNKLFKLCLFSVLTDTYKSLVKKTNKIKSNRVTLDSSLNINLFKGWKNKRKLYFKIFRYFWSLSRSKFSPSLRAGSGSGLGNFILLTTNLGASRTGLFAPLFYFNKNYKKIRARVVRKLEIGYRNIGLKRLILLDNLLNKTKNADLVDLTIFEPISEKKITQTQTIAVNQLEHNKIGQQYQKHKKIYKPNFFSIKTPFFPPIYGFKGLRGMNYRWNFKRAYSLYRFGKLKIRSRVIRVRHLFKQLRNFFKLYKLGRDNKRSFSKVLTALSLRTLENSFQNIFSKISIDYDFTFPDVASTLSSHNWQAVKHNLKQSKRQLFLRREVRKLMRYISLHQYYLKNRKVLCCKFYNSLVKKKKLSNKKEKIVEVAVSEEPEEEMPVIQEHRTGPKENIDDTDAAKQLREITIKAERAAFEKKQRELITRKVASEVVVSNKIEAKSSDKKKAEIVNELPDYFDSPREIYPAVFKFGKYGYRRKSLNVRHYIGEPSRFQDTAISRLALYKLNSYLISLRGVFSHALYRYLSIPSEIEHRGGKRRSFRYYNLRSLTVTNQMLLRLGLGTKFYFRSFVLKLKFLDLIVSSFWRYVFLVFFKNTFDSILRIYGFKRVVLQINSTDRMLSADFMTRYIIKEMRKNFSVSFVMKQVRRGFRFLMREGKLFGYKVCFSGRFSRKQMATYVWRKGGRVALGSDWANIDYASQESIMTYGKCGIKIWLHVRK